jgi:phage terminase large subunit-like protein
MSVTNPLLLRRQLVLLPEDVRARVLSELPDEVVVSLSQDWAFRAREKQLPPEGDDWLVWLILAGRGFGKTRTGAETVRQWAKDHPGCRIALVARTAADVRDVMVEGESGIMNLPGDEDFRPTYEPSKRRLTWPNGSMATTFSADEPNALRGPQHHFAWS